MLQNILGNKAKFSIWEVWRLVCHKLICAIKASVVSADFRRDFKALVKMELLTDFGSTM